jgi:aspartyl-tRNA(Asn)/glutamyl-tRNA(Gln) amidotransferase subunit A
MSDSAEFAFQSATVARAGLVSGLFSAVEYVSALLHRIELSNPQLHAFVSVSWESALRAARRADQRRAAGGHLPPLHGIPFAVKDLFDVRSTSTRAHSRVPAQVAGRTAEAVLRLQRQGGIFLGKLALEEFGIGSPLDDLAWPSPKNPWDHRRTTGGSSSGCGVALAAGLTPMALGTDTGGSVRAPAAFCGLVALKPTDGRLSKHGVLPLAPTLDTIGPMARSAEDCALLFAGVATGSTATGFGASRIGRVDVDSAGLSVDAVVVQAMDAALKVLEALGHRTDTVDFPHFAVARELGGVILRHEAYTVHRERLRSFAHLYGASCRSSLERGAAVCPQAYASALERRERLQVEVDRVFQSCDVLALPVTFGTAAALDDAQALGRAGNVAFRLPFNVTGHPALVFCTGFDPEGMPLSMQLVGRRGEDERLLALATAYQSVTVWHELHPPEAVG